MIAPRPMNVRESDKPARQYKIEIHVNYQKDPIVHNTIQPGAYDNRHFYNVYENRVDGTFRTTHRYPVQNIIKVIENLIP